MPKLKRLSGREVLKIFQRFGFDQISQRGSHIKLRRVQKSGEKQTLIIPAHEEMDRGTLLALIRQASRFIPADDLISYFYTS